jgi:methylenetetrahydrofolate dehydrogenase (NADP+)/methenyltetrahydrofolate cyclohydrolase
MTARLIDGKAIARGIRDRVSERVSRFAPGTVTLAAVEVAGGPGGSAVYAASQKKCAQALGIAFRRVRLPAGTGEAGLLEAIDALNSDPAVHGILLLRPLPEGIDTERAACRIRPDKDVEGMHPANLGSILYKETGLVPCTAMAAVTVLRSTGISFEGLETVVVGHSEIVGKPIALMMVNALSTVTICHIATADLGAHTRRADILFTAAGVPGLVTAGMIKPGAAVIDIAINSVKDSDGGGERVVGDVDFEAASAVAGWITPVPGGVGPVTTAVLMENTVKAAESL